MTPRKSLMSPRLGYTFAFALLMVVFVWIAWVAFAERSEHQRRQVDKSNLKRIGMALHQYQEKYQTFPPASIADSAGKKLHSWRVLILPFLGEDELYQKYDFSQPWDSLHNRELLGACPKVYQNAWLNPSPGRTAYLAIVDKRTAWPGPIATRIADVRDGLSNTIHLVNVPESNRDWMEPEDIALEELGGLALSTDNSVPVRQHLMMDGMVRAIAPSIDRDLYFSIISINNGATHPLFHTQEDRPPLPFPPLTPVENLSATNIRVCPTIPAEQGQNEIYCATFRAAWEMLRQAQGTDKVELLSETPISRELNRMPFSHRILSGKSFYAAAAEPTLLRSQLVERFPDIDLSTANSWSSTQDPNKTYLTCFAYLRRPLPFAHRFVRLSNPLAFNSQDRAKKVVAFGYDPADPAIRAVAPGDLQDALRQVEVLYDADDSDFVLKLKTTGEQDDLIYLARVPKAASLQETWESVRERIQHPQKALRRELEMNDRLRIPVISFHLQHMVTELNGLKLAKPVTNGIHDELQSNQQLIGFQLDEAGAEILSWADIKVVGEDGEEPARFGPRTFDFNGPFLLAVEENGADEPYMIVWIENTELLRKYSE